MSDSAREIENLVYTYAERLDAGDLDGVAALFAHGRIAGMEDGPPETVFTGVSGVRKMYEMATRLYEDGTPKTRHLTSNVRIVVDDAATAMQQLRDAIDVCDASLVDMDEHLVDYDEAFLRVVQRHRSASATSEEVAA